MNRNLLCTAVFLFATALTAPARTSATETVIDIGNCELHADVLGAGAPAVIFETGGGGGPRSHWGDLPARLAAITRVVTYDRAGIGASDPATKPRTGPQIAKELHSLLHALRIPPPYVLVGHSLGGLYIRFFADLYPEEVAGFVFLDPTTEDMRPKLDTAKSREVWAAQLAQLPPGAQAEMELLPALVEAASNLGPPPDRPTVVITGMKRPEIPDDQREAMEAAGVSEETLREGQQRAWLLHGMLATQFPDARHVAATESGHYVHWDQPELVEREIRAVLGEVQSPGGG